MPAAKVSRLLYLGRLVSKIYNVLYLFYLLGKARKWMQVQQLNECWQNYGFVTIVWLYDYKKMCKKVFIDFAYSFIKFDEFD